MNLKDALAKGRQDFAATARHPNFTLVISHNKRKKFNREQNLQDRWCCFRKSAQDYLPRKCTSKYVDLAWFKDAGRRRKMLERRIL